MNGWTVRKAALCLVIALPAGTGLTQGTGRPTATPVRQAAAAMNMADLGRQAGDPVMLVAAARMLDALAVQTPGGPDPADTVLDEAEALAAGDHALRTRIATLRQEARRGILRGPRQTVERLEPGAVQRFDFTFAGGEPADAEVRLRPGSEGAQFDIRALDDQGQQVAREHLRGRAAYVSWSPQECGRFTLELRNISSQPAEYLLTTALSTTPSSTCRNGNGAP